MAKRLHRRSSKGPPSEEYQPGCMRGIFHLWGFQHRFRNPKRISGWRKGVEGSKYSKLKNHEDVGIESDSTVKNYGEVEDDQNLCNRTPSPRLTRTLSIHHLECNDYVVPPESDRSKRAGEVEIEASSSDLERRNVVEYPKTGTSSWIGLGRSGSYPRAKQQKSGIRRKKGGFSISENRDDTPFSGSYPSLEPVGSFKDDKEIRLRDMTTTEPAGKETPPFIAMDGIMDKIPYGRTSSRDWGEPMSSSFNRNRWRSKSMHESPAPPDEMRSAIPRFSRSRSIADPFPPSNSDFKSHSRSNSMIGDSPMEYLLEFPSAGFDVATLDRDSSKQQQTELVEAEAAGIHLDGSNPPGGAEEVQVDAQSRNRKTGNLSPPSVLEEFEEDGSTSPAVDNATTPSDFAQSVLLRSPAAADKSPTGRKAAAYWIDEVERIELNDSDRKDDVRYIMDVLVRTEFQHTYQLPLSPTAFKQLEGLSPDTDICTLYADIDLNHLLLFDLVNEILIEMHESSSAPFSWRSFFDFDGTSFSANPRCLGIFWTNVARCLGGSSSNMDLRIHRDLSTNNGWTNPFPNFQVQDVGMEVEDIILDDLLDQLILDELPN